MEEQEYDLGEDESLVHLVGLQKSAPVPENVEEHAGDADPRAREESPDVRKEHGRVQRGKNRDAVPELDDANDGIEEQVLE